MRKEIFCLLGASIGFAIIPLFVWLCGVDFEFERTPLWAMFWFFSVFFGIAGYSVANDVY